KNLGACGDAGMVLTDRDDLAARLSRLRHHGDHGRYQHVEFGYSSRLDEVQAALLAVKVRHLDAWTERRRRIAARYRDLLGGVGLGLAVAVAESGATVVGVDLDAQRVAAVRAGRSFVEDVPSETVARLVTGGRLRATEDVVALKDADAIVVCVPTPLGKSKEPDISFIVSAADAIARIIRRGQLVVLESTTYPGTTREILLPRLEAGGLKAGEDFFLAFSPERIDPGNRRFTL